MPHQRMVSHALSKLGAALSLMALLASGPALADELVIATASPAGVYHITGRALCSLVDIPCEARTSGGSAANLTALRDGEVPVALAQSDLQHYAVTGSAGFATVGPDPNLRAIAALHGEPFTLVVRRDSGITGFADLRGRSVNVGNPGSGQRGTMMTLLEAWGWSLRDFRPANELPADQQSLELCHGNIEAMVYTVGHPNPSIAQAVRLCDAILVEVGGEPVDRLVAGPPYLTRATIPAGLYGDDQPAVETFGVRATLVTSAAVDEALIYRLVATLFDNLDSFKAFHPAYADLSPETMIREGLSAPLHEGALRYYRERGWIEDAAPAPETEAFSAPGADRGSSD